MKRGDPSVRARPARPRTAAVPAAALLLAAALGGCGLFPKEKPIVAPVLPEPPSESSSITYPVTRTDIAETIEGNAEISPTREAALYFKEPGRIKEITAEVNRPVAAGEVLARLDIGDLEHQLRLATIDQQITEVGLERMKAMPSNPLDRRIQELSIARARENVDWLQGRVDASTIRAPFAGVVGSVEASVSERVMDYATVITVADPSSLELQMRINRDQSYSVSTGLLAEVSTGDERWLPTRVIQTTHRDPSRDASVRAEEFIVHLGLPRGFPATNLGSMVGVRIVLRGKKGALVIPLAGLREFGGRTYVRVKEGEARHEQDVSIGIRTATDVEIVSGLSEGQLVIGR